MTSLFTSRDRALKRSSRLCFFAAFLLSFSSLTAQTFYTVNLDTTCQTTPKKICMQATTETGMLIGNFQTPEYANQFWWQGDVWIDSDLSEAAPYFCFGDDTLLYAVGYSQAVGKIQLMKVEQVGSYIQLTELESKAVDILPEEKRYVFKHIFFHATNEFRFEVNGVPMRLPSPVNSRSISRFGYLVRGEGKVVRFARPGVKGK